MLYAAINTNSKHYLRWMDTAATGPTRVAFLHRFTEKHDISETEFLVDAGGYLTALARQDRAVISITKIGTTSKVIPDCRYAN